MFQHQRAQSKQGKRIRYNHQVIEHIRQLPDQIIGQAGPQENEDDCHKGKDLCRPCTKKISHVNLGKQIPAENGGKGETNEYYVTIRLKDGRGTTPSNTVKVTAPKPKDADNN